MTSSFKMTLYSPGYKMISPSGIHMQYVSAKKAHWYVERNLAKIDTENKTLQLTFIPNGLGKYDDPFYNSDKENICVVCGTDKELTLHHCVPRAFRKCFPPEYKNNLCHDVLSVCETCHQRYEKIALERHKQFVDTTDEQKKLHRIWRSINRLTVRTDIEESKRAIFVKELENYIGEVTDEKILQFIEKGKPSTRPDYQGFIDSLDSLDEFIKSWRRHFVETTNPKFLPKHWSIDSPIK